MPHPHTFVLSYLAEKQFLQVTLEETHTSLKTREAELSPSTDGRADCISGDEAPGRSPFHQPEQVSFCWGCFDTSHVLCSPHTLKSRPSTHTQCALPFPLSIQSPHLQLRPVSILPQVASSGTLEEGCFKEGNRRGRQGCLLRLQEAGLGDSDTVRCRHGCSRLLTVGDSEACGERLQ